MERMSGIMKMEIYGNRFQFEQNWSKCKSITKFWVQEARSLTTLHWIEYSYSLEIVGALKLITAKKFAILKANVQSIKTEDHWLRHVTKFHMTNIRKVMLLMQKQRKTPTCCCSNVGITPPWGCGSGTMFGFIPAYGLWSNPATPTPTPMWPPPCAPTPAKNRTK